MVIGEKTERRSGGATLQMLVILGFLVAGCGGGSRSSTPAPPAPSPGLWVPNFFNFDVTALNAQQRAKSGAPDPALRNDSAAIDSPEEALFDASGDLWLTNCSDQVIGAGTIMEFTSDQLKNLSKDHVPKPNVSLSDDGSFNIFGCPYGEAFGSDGSLWAANRFSADLVNFTPSQLSAGGVTVTTS